MLQLALLAAVAYAALILVLRRSQAGPDRLPPVPNLMLVCIVAGVVLAGGPAIEGDSLAIPDGTTALILVGYAITAQVAGWMLITRGLPRVEAGHAGLLLLLQPTLAFIWDIAFFARPTDASDVAGATLALCAIYLGTVGRGPRP